MKFNTGITKFVLAGTFIAAALSVTLVPATGAAESQPEPRVIADCWSESGQDLADGEFIVNLDTTKISKANLLSVLNLLNGVNLMPTNYPLIFDKQVFVTVRGVDNSFPQMSRAEFKKAVEAELEAIVLVSQGISASCNYISYPAPAVGVRN